MKLINISEDKQSFWICAISGPKKFNIKEFLLCKQGKSTDHSGKEYNYVEYKIRVLVNKFGMYRTYIVWYVDKKNAWYIIDDCIDLLENPEVTFNNYQYR